jgi:exonuclease III
MLSIPGILIISRIKPSKVIYGFAYKPETGGDARLVTAVFDNIVVSGCYAPYNNQQSPRMEARKAWVQHATNLLMLWNQQWLGSLLFLMLALSSSLETV